MPINTINTMGCSDFLSPPEVVIQVSEMSLLISWTPIHNATAYDIEHSDSPDGPFLFVESTGATSVAIPISEDLMKFYRVIARN